MAFLTLFGLSFIGAGLCLDLPCAVWAPIFPQAWFDRFPRRTRRSSLCASHPPPMTTKALVPAARFSEGASDDNVPAERGKQAGKETRFRQNNSQKMRKNENGSVIFKPKYLTPCRTSHTSCWCSRWSSSSHLPPSEALDADKWVGRAQRLSALTAAGMRRANPSVPHSPSWKWRRSSWTSRDRKIVIRYDASATMVTVSCYDLYPGEYNISRSDTGTDRYIVSITRTPEPAHDADIDKMLDLCFQPNRIEKQVIRHHPRGIPQQCGDHHRSARHLREGLVSKRIKKRAADAALFHALTRLQSLLTIFLRWLRGIPCCSAPSRSRRRV